MVRVDFAGLPAGTELADQLPGLTFLKYDSVVSAVVAVSEGIPVASFTESAAEFFPSGGDIAFASLQHTVTLHVGLLPVEGAVVQRVLRLTGFDAGGAVEATAAATVTAGAGFDTPITVSVPEPRLASVVLEAANDQDLNAAIAARDVIFDDAGGGGPDFELLGPTAVTVVQGGPAVDVRLTIDRIGGSAGAVDVSIWPGTLPSGVTADLLPGVPTADTVTLQLQATIGYPPTSGTTAIILARPTSPQVGPTPRSLGVEVDTVPLVQVTGPSDIDVGGCTPDAAAAHGIVSVSYWVNRYWSFSEPVSVTVENLPPGVTATVFPPTLTFPGAVTAEQVTVQLSMLAGPPVPDTIATLRVTGAGVNVALPLSVHGTCAQRNRNFVIRGQFLVNDMTLIHPLDHAQVEIFRYRSDWFDDWVGATMTDDRGSFSCDLYASEDGDYYARLRLFGAELQLEDAIPTSVWSWDTPHQSNRGGLIDTGTTIFVRDNGAGAPRAAVWRAARQAILEFQGFAQQDSSLARGAGFLTIIALHVVSPPFTPTTIYDVINWLVGYRTGEGNNPDRAVTHEYGHLLRDRLDGDADHWHADDVHYVYARGHDSCPGQDEFGLALDEKGFAFHEGWAEYWSADTRCCPNASGNEAIEGTVAFDLKNLEQLQPPGGGAIVGRPGMLHVLARGTNLIHSDTEFRREYAQQFPGLVTVTPPLSAGCPPGTTTPLTGHFAPADSAAIRQSLLTATDSYREYAHELQAREAETTGAQRYLLQAAAHEALLIGGTLARQITDLDHASEPGHWHRRRHHRPSHRWRRARATFLAKRDAIQLRALRDALPEATPEQRAAIERRIHLLEHPGITDHTVHTLLPPIPVPGDDTTHLHPPNG